MERELLNSSEDKQLAIMENLCAQLRHNTKQLRSQMEQMQKSWVLEDNITYGGKWRSGRSRLGLYFGKVTRIEKWITRSLPFQSVLIETENAEIKRQIRSESFSNELPRFNGEGVNGWISKAEQFFQRYGIEDDEKVLTSSLHLEGIALSWYNWMSFAGFFTSWDRFVEELRLRFDFVEDSSSEDQSNNSVLVLEFESNAHSATDLEIESQVDESNGDTVQTVSDKHGDKFACLENFMESDLQVSEADNDGEESKEVSRDNVGDKVDDKFACFESFVAPDLVVSEVENGVEKPQVESVKFDGKTETFVSNEALLAESFESVAIAISVMDVPSDPNKLSDAVFSDFHKESIKCLEEVEESSSRKELSEFDDEKGTKQSVIWVDASMSGRSGMGIYLDFIGIDALCGQYSFEGLVKAKQIDVGFFTRHFSHQDELVLGELVWDNHSGLCLSIKKFGDGLSFTLMGMVCVLKMFLEYKELLSWIYELGDKFNAKGRAMLRDEEG